MASYTPRQRDVLRVMLGALRKADVAGMSGPTLAAHLSPGAPVQGVHITAASLVRAGLLDRIKQNGHVVYELTPAGRSVAKAVS